MAQAAGSQPTNPRCVVPGRKPSHQSGPSAPGSLVDFINPVLMLVGKGRDTGSGVGLAHGSLGGWPATPVSPSELASSPSEEEKEHGRTPRFGSVSLLDLLEGFTPYIVQTDTRPQ